MGADQSYAGVPLKAQFWSLQMMLWVTLEFHQSKVGAERDTSPYAVVEHCKLKSAHTVLL